MHFHQDFLWGWKAACVRWRTCSVLLVVTGAVVCNGALLLIQEAKVGSKNQIFVIVAQL